MSNHLHLVVTDHFRELPKFMHILDLEIAKAVSAEIGRWGGFWESGKSYSAVDLLDQEAVIDEVAYTLANPVSAGLVRRADRWPGATSTRFAFGEFLVARRPNTAYYRSGVQPESCSLRLEAPPGLDPIDCLERVRARVRKIEKNKEIEMRVKRRKFIGPRRVLRQNPYDSPTTWETRRGRNPTFASRDRLRLIEAAQRKHDWLSAYRRALDIFRSGFRDVVFPAGTWAMQRIYGCNCAVAPT